MNHMPQQTETEHQDPDHAGMRNLWIEVLLMGLKEASGYVTDTSARSHALIVQQARSWLRSTDFDAVCDMAGIDADFAREAYEAGKFTRENWTRMCRAVHNREAQS